MSIQMDGQFANQRFTQENEGPVYVTAPQAGDSCEVCGYSLCKHGFCRDLDCEGSRDEKGYQCQDCAEAQQQRMIEDYYGGDTPQTDREREEVRLMQNAGSSHANTRFLISALMGGF